MKKRVSTIAFLAFMSLLNALQANAQVRSDQVVLGQQGWLLYTEDWREQVWNTNFQTVINLRIISEAFAQKNIPVFFAITPSKVDIYPEYLPKSYPQLPNEIYTRYNDLCKLLEVANLRTINLKSALIKQKNAHPEKNLWTMRDSHWSPYGAYIAGQAIGNEIVNLGWTKTLSPMQFNITWEKKFFNTDLGKVVPKDKAQIYPLVDSTQVPTLDIKNVGLIDQADPAIVLVGSSFGRLPFPGLHIGIADSTKQEVVNNTVSGGGVWGGLIDYLKTANNQAKPKVIVWEIPERLFDDYQPKVPMQTLLEEIKALP